MNRFLSSSVAALAVVALAASPAIAKDKDKDKDKGSASSSGSSSGSSSNSGNGSSGSSGSSSSSSSASGSGSSGSDTGSSSGTGGSSSSGSGSGGSTGSTSTGASSNIVLLNLSCQIATGCLFGGNDVSAAGIISAFTSAMPGASLDLSFSEKVEFAGSVYSGAWTSLVPISFLTVKAGNEFMLYQLAQPTAAGAWSTAGLVNNQGIAHAVSHISLWTSPFSPPPIIEPPPVPPVFVPPDIINGQPGSIGEIVTENHGAIPEPATWISMILGFGGMGAVLRRRRANAAAA